jgi:hypothetical protein
MLTKLIPRNEHTIDRVVRVTLGVGLLALTVTGPKTLLGLVGLIPLITGIVGSCPIYTLLGLKTCKSCEA